MKKQALITMLVILIFGITTLSFAQTVTTDKPDYEPGEAMIITGYGFQVEEDLRIQILDLDRNSIVYEQVIAADHLGDFTMNWINPPLLNQDDFLWHAAVNALGLASGFFAQVEFTDGIETRFVPGQITPNEGCRGETITARATLEYKGPPWRPLSGMTVTFTLGTSTETGTTNTDGVATVSLVVPNTASELVASFGGYAAYEGVTDRRIFTVISTCATPPTINCPADITVYNDAGQCGANVTFTASATGTPAPSISYSHTSGSLFPVGTTTVVTATATNSAGTDVCTFYVIVNDNEAPVPTLSSLPNMNNECSVTLIPPTAIDNCAGTITGTTTDPLEYTEQGTYTITWTFDDGNGNVSQQTQYIEIDDVTLPDLPTLSLLSDQCSVTISEAPKALDNCVGEVEGAAYDANDQPLTLPIEFDQQGNFSVIWKYDDGNGNVSQQTQYIEIDDITPPDLPTLSLLSDQCSVTISEAPKALDNCVGEVEGAAYDANDQPLTLPIEFDQQGNFLVIWKYDDGNGNVSQQTQYIEIDDVTPPDLPTLSLLSDQCSVTISEAPKALDNCVGEVEGAAYDANDQPLTLPIEFDQQGNFSVIWKYDDGNGNVSQQTQYIEIDDVTPPVFNPNSISQKTFSVCEPVNLVDPTATDNCGGEVTISRDMSQVFELGTNTVVWTADDGNGNTSTANQTVNINYGYIHGFLPPMIPNGGTIKVKMGSTVPLKYQLMSCLTEQNAKARIYYSNSNGTADTGEPVPGLSTTGGDAGNIFRYSDGQYIFNLSTKSGFSLGIYRVFAILPDGQEISGFINITK